MLIDYLRDRAEAVLSDLENSAQPLLIPTVIFAKLALEDFIQVFEVVSVDEAIAVKGAKLK